MFLFECDGLAWDIVKNDLEQEHSLNYRDDVIVERSSLRRAIGCRVSHGLFLYRNAAETIALIIPRRSQ